MLCHQQVIQSRDLLLEMHFVISKKEIKIPPRGITLCLQVLIKHDLVGYNVNDEIHIVDPVLAYWLRSGSAIR